jgi:hypothetical protein
LNVAGRSAIGGFVTGTIGGAAGGFVGGYAAGYLMTGDSGAAWDMAINGAITGGITAGVFSGIRGFRAARALGKNPWTGIADKTSIQLTKARFGHAFTTHGDDATKFLMNRAKGSGMAQGQFLNNQKAAQFILDNVHKAANGAVNVAIPKGFPARVIMPDGTFKAATHIRLVPGGGGVKTAYPLILGL